MSSSCSKIEMLLRVSNLIISYSLTEGQRLLMVSVSNQKGRKASLNKCLSQKERKTFLSE